MPVSSSFLEQLADSLAFVPGYRTRRMFGGVGVFAGELMFGAVFEDTLYLKVDAESTPAFEARGLPVWIYRDRKGQQTAMGYRQAPEEVLEDPDAAREWIELALAAARRKKR